MNISSRIKMTLAAYDAGDITISKMESIIKGFFTAFHYDETQHMSEVLNTIDPVKDDGPKWNDFIGTEGNGKKDLLDAITEEGSHMRFSVDGSDEYFCLGQIIKDDDGLTVGDVFTMQALQVGEVMGGLGADVERVV